MIGSGSGSLLAVSHGPSAPQSARSNECAASFSLSSGALAKQGCSINGRESLNGLSSLCEFTLARAICSNAFFPHERSSLIAGPSQS